jgi:hypothetical protein
LKFIECKIEYENELPIYHEDKDDTQEDVYPGKLYLSISAENLLEFLTNHSSIPTDEG